METFSFKFLKPISRIERGAYTDAIIVWDKEEIMFETKIIEPAFGVANRVERIPLQYRWFIRINLWLIVIDLCWRTKVKKT